MTSPSSGSAGRPPLGREEVVRAALDLLDEVGLDGLTMRTLAERLGVKAASLYWHLRHKDELQDLMVEAINAQLPDPDPALPWRESLERQAWAWRRLLLRHRDAARLVMGRFVARPNTLRQVEHVLAALRGAGFSDQDVANAGYLFSTFVPGFVAEETTRKSPSPSTREVRGGVAAAAGSPSPLEDAHLEIGWASRLTVVGDPALPGLYRVDAEGREPEVEAHEGVVTLRTRGRRPCTLALSSAVPWTIHLRGGASHLTADLRAIRLLRLEIRGGASAVEILVPSPWGTVPIEVTGGANRLSIHRPAEVPVRLELRGGISKLAFDHRPFPAAGELTLQSPGYDRADDRLAVSITGGASRISIDTELPTSPAEAPSARAEPGARSPADATAELYPTLSALSPMLLQTSMDERFAFGLRVLLDGLERLPRPVQKS